MATLPYSGGSRSNVRLPHEPEEKPADEPEESEPDEGDDDSGSEEKTFDRSKYSRSRASTSAPKAIRISGDATGAVLALLLWGWVVLPYLGVTFTSQGKQTSTSGVAGIKDVWRAKFLNKGPDGSWLS